ncbi:MAG: ankyrin repeat domain-containing protein [Terriglobus roseus]|nr:ankyrin repeat domain-containing protein [Terriglobus roseus]
MTITTTTTTPADHDPQGASPRELLLESCRRNNTDLLATLLADPAHTAPALTALLNDATDGLGNHALHVAAAYGAYEVLDLLLDQEGLEVDPLDRLERDTPLHKAVRWVNGLGADEARELGPERVSGVVEILVDAGCDPRCVVLAPQPFVLPRGAG